MDKVKLIKEIKNYVQGINLVQVRGRPLRGAGRREPGRPASDLALCRRRSWWSRCPRRSKPTSPRPRRRRSRPRWRRWAAPWSWSRLPENCGQGSLGPGIGPAARPAPRPSCPAPPPRSRRPHPPATARQPGRDRHGPTERAGRSAACGHPGHRPDWTAPGFTTRPLVAAEKIHGLGRARCLCVLGSGMGVCRRSPGSETPQPAACTVLPGWRQIFPQELGVQLPPRPAGVRLCPGPLESASRRVKTAGALLPGAFLPCPRPGVGGRGCGIP